MEEAASLISFRTEKMYGFGDRSEWFGRSDFAGTVPLYCSGGRRIFSHSDDLAEKCNMRISNKIISSPLGAASRRCQSQEVLVGALLG